MTTRPHSWHGESKTKLYNIWRHMMSKCAAWNSNDKALHNYAGRGITFHPPWRNYVEFAKDVRSEIGDHPGGSYSLDRVNNDGNYEPGNIRWATKLQQGRNTRSYKPEKHSGPQKKGPVTK